MERDHNRWFLDCAHNTLSLPVALEWFESEAGSQPTCETGVPRVLIFGHESMRSTHDLIRLIVQHCEDRGRMFDLVILPPYERYGMPVLTPFTCLH